MSQVIQPTIGLSTPSPRVRRLTWQQVLGKIASVVLIGLLTVYILGPLLVLLIWAFAKEWFYPALLPQAWTLSWWQTIFSTGNFGHSILLSFLIAPVVTLATAAICFPAAYGFSRYRFRGRWTMLISIFAINSFPKMGIYITLAGFFYGLHLIGTFPGVVIVQMLGTIVTATWIPTAAFSAVPRELEEASRDAGAGAIRTFMRVTLPSAKPGLIIALILTFLSSLDEAQGTFIVGAPYYQTMPVVMYGLVNGYPEQAAAVFSVLLTLPSLILLLFVRKYIIGGAFASAFRLH